MTKDEVAKQIQELLKKEKMRMGLQVTFPIYNILPDEVRLALNIIAKHGAKIGFVLEEHK